MTHSFFILAQSLGLQIALMALVVAGLSVYMIATRNRVRRSMNQPHHGSRGRTEQQVRRTHLTRDLEEVMTELDELARQVNGKLDVRFAKLEAIIRDADERIDQLGRMLRQAAGQATLDVMISADDPSGQDGTEGDRLTSPDGAQRPDSGETQHAEVYELADQGLTPVDIATKTDRTAGEVELILALRRAKTQADSIAKSREPVAAVSRP